MIGGCTAAALWGAITTLAVSLPARTHASILCVSECGAKQAIVLFLVTFNCIRTRLIWSALEKVLVLYLLELVSVFTRQEVRAATESMSILTN